MADTILTDTPGWAALNVPTPGDPVKAALPDGAVRSGYQKLANRTAAMIEGLHSPARTYILRDVLGVLYDLIIEPLGWVGLVDSGGKWTLIYHDVTDTYDVTTPGALAADTRYWVYGYESGGVLAYERSTTAPDSRLQYKTGDKSRVYITTFVTNDSMVPVGYTQSGRVYTYELFVPSTTEGGTAGGPHGNLVLNDAMITGFATALNLGIAVPNYARQAVVKAGTVGFAASSRIVLSNRLSSSINGRYLDYTGTNDFMIQATIDQTANRGAPAQMYYTWSSTNLAMLLNLWVVSFVE